MNRSDLAFLESIFGMPVNQITSHILVVNQSARADFVSAFENIRVINSPHFGLSRSRNLALENGLKALCWFLDDDVVVTKNAVDDILDAFNKDFASVLKIFKIDGMDGKSFRKYARDLKSPKNPADLRGLCSIEMVVNRTEVLKTEVRFREDLGLGTSLPIGEEFVFAAQLLEKQMGISYESAVIAKHPSVHSASDIMNERVLAARGKVYAILYPKCKTLQVLKYAFHLVQTGHVKSIGQFFNTYKQLKITF